METVTDETFFSRAGRLADRHAMFWIRTLHAPLRDVWSMVSTQAGLERWWIVPPERFELRVGGEFRHHWNNTIADVREGSFIDFAQPTGAYKGTGGMRFELAASGNDSTLFTFLDTWGPRVIPPGGEEPQPGGAGTPWAGVAAGWHHMMDGIDRIFDLEAPHPTYDELRRFYSTYLSDLYRLHDMVQRIDGRSTGTG
jgi:uncharacterized protein YndB with AHSA1/START domain